MDKEYPMVSTTNAFSSFSVNDLDAARAFYADVVGLEVDQTPWVWTCASARADTCSSTQGEPRRGVVHDPQLRGRRRRRGGRRARREGCGVRALRGVRPGRQGHRARSGGSGDRLVQGPGAQRPRDLEQPVSSAMASHEHLLAAHGDAVGAFDHLVRQVTDDQWGLPTPDDAWTVRDLVNHLVSEQLWAPELLAGRTVADVGSVFDGDVLGDDPIDAWVDASTQSREAFLAPVPWTAWCTCRMATPRPPSTRTR
ncbi:maleylpyruvate isomerase N-terminal domain-containing protein [Oerskovia sp. M15]